MVTDDLILHNSVFCIIVSGLWYGYFCFLAESSITSLQKGLLSEILKILLGNNVGSHHSAIPHGLRSGQKRGRPLGSFPVGVVALSAVMLSVG